MNLGRSKYSPIGLDVGATSIRMAQLKRTARGWTVQDMVMKDIPHADQMDGASRKDMIVRAIVNGMNDSSISGKTVVSVMPGYQLDIYPVKLAVGESESLDEIVLRESRAHLSYDAERAVIDYMLVNDNESVDERKIKRSLLVAARREDVDEHLSVLRGAKLKPLALDISACAVARLIRNSLPGRKKINALIANVGELHTTLTLLWKDNVFLDRNILWGRENIVESLMKRFDLDRPRAYGLLSRAGTFFRQGDEEERLSKNDEHLNKVSDTLYESVALQSEKLANEIDKVLQYFSSEMRGAAIDNLYIMGAVRTIRNLDRYLENRTGVSTRFLDPLSFLKIGDNGGSRRNSMDGSFFGVALGLAMRGLEPVDRTVVQK